MSDNTDYTAALTTAWEELPKPKTLPEGSWLVVLRNAVYIEPKQADHSPKVVYFYKAKEPMNDVSSVAIEALGADYDYSINDLTFTQYLESTADWQKKVLPFMAKHSGFERKGNPQESLKGMRNLEIVSYLSLKQWTDKITNEEHVDNAMSGFVALDS